MAVPLSEKVIENQLSKAFNAFLMMDLRQHMNVNSQMLGSLVMSGLITKTEQTNVESIEDAAQKNDEIIVLLLKNDEKVPNAYDKFIEALNKSGQQELTSRLLKRKDNTSSNGRETADQSSGKREIPPRLLNAERPLSPSCSYFEYEIIGWGEDGAIAIGLVPEDYPNYMMPGWKPSSFGYHADDGGFFNGKGQAKLFLETCAVGDRMGCGIKFGDAENTIYFTKNGCEIFEFVLPDQCCDLYPAIGMHSEDQAVRLMNDISWISLSNEPRITQRPAMSSASVAVENSVPGKRKPALRKDKFGDRYYIEVDQQTAIARYVCPPAEPASAKHPRADKRPHVAEVRKRFNSTGELEKEKPEKDDGDNGAEEETRSVNVDKSARLKPTRYNSIGGIEDDDESTAGVERSHGKENKSPRIRRQRFNSIGGLQDESDDESPEVEKSQSKAEPAPRQRIMRFNSIGGIEDDGDDLNEVFSQPEEAHPNKRPTQQIQRNPGSDPNEAQLIDEKRHPGKMARPSAPPRPKRFNSIGGVEDDDESTAEVDQEKENKSPRIRRQRFNSIGGLEDESDDESPEVEKSQSKAEPAPRQRIMRFNSIGGIEDDGDDDMNEASGRAVMDQQPVSQPTRSSFIPVTDDARSRPSRSTNQSHVRANCKTRGNDRLGDKRPNTNDDQHIKDLRRDCTDLARKNEKLVEKLRQVDMLVHTINPLGVATKSCRNEDVDDFVELMASTIRQCQDEAERHVTSIRVHVSNVVDDMRDIDQQVAVCEFMTDKFEKVCTELLERDMAFLDEHLEASELHQQSAIPAVTYRTSTDYSAEETERRNENVRKDEVATVPDVKQEDHQRSVTCSEQRLAEMQGAEREHCLNICDDIRQFVQKRRDMAQPQKHGKSKNPGKIVNVVETTSQSWRQTSTERSVESTLADRLIDLGDEIKAAVEIEADQNQRARDELVCRQKAALLDVKRLERRLLAAETERDFYRRQYEQMLIIRASGLQLQTRPTKLGKSKDGKVRMSLPAIRRRPDGPRTGDHYDSIEHQK